MTYAFLKACHLIAIVAWFAGLFYVFRLFVYHRRNAGDERVEAVLRTMERRLLKAIILPASIAALLTGVLLISSRPELVTRFWFLGKMSFVALLLTYQTLAWKTYSRFRDGRYSLSEGACRALNEVPTIVLIGAVLLAVLKPWGGL